MRREKVIRLHDLQPPRGSHRPRRRVARGTAGKGGKTAGRGTKGQGARDTVKPGFEGGQLPLKQRIPKLRGFTNPFRISYHVVNLDALELSAVGQGASSAGEKGAAAPSAVTPETLAAAGAVRRGALVKVLGRGELTRPLLVRAHAFSASARASIESAGGRCEVIDLPYPTGRPPVRGSAHTNR